MVNFEKLENKQRVEELNPSKTLIKIGLEDNDVLCDIGAGTGIFTIAGAKITNNTVFSLEINDELLNVIKDKAKQENLTNIKALKVNDNHYDIQNNLVDFAILVTVFHEIDDKISLLSEIRRVLKQTGKLIIIEFHDKKTEIGPPVEHRIGKELLNEICSSHGFFKMMEFDLGDNFYCVGFEMSK